MDSNENDVVEITDINSILADEKVKKTVCNCSTIYVDSINEFINKIKDGYDLESVFLCDSKLYKKLYSECKKLLKEKKPEFYFLQVRFMLNREVKFSQRKIYKLLKKCKFKDFPYYNFYMGEIYRYGIGVRLDYKKAVEYYKKAVINKVTPAFVALGECYLYGFGVDKNYVLAYKHFDDAFKVGNKRAMFYKGKLLQNGYGVNEDKVGAFKIFKCLVDENYFDAFYELSLCYLFGYGVSVDFIEGMKLANEGIKRNDMKCNIIYGLNYMYGLINKKNYKKARYYFIKAIDNGFYDGCYYIGVMKFNGMGYWKSSKDALDVFLLGKEHYSLLCINVLEDKYYKNKFNKYSVDKKYSKDKIVLIQQ